MVHKIYESLIQKVLTDNYINEIAYFPNCIGFSTKFLSPEGAYIDIYLYDGYLSDGCNSLVYWKDYGIEFDEYKDLINDILHVYDHVKCKNGELRVEFNSENLPQRFLILIQACIRIISNVHTIFQLKIKK